MIEKALLDFERALPSSAVKQFPVTLEALNDARGLLQRMRSIPRTLHWRKTFDRLAMKKKPPSRIICTPTAKGFPKNSA